MPHAGYPELPGLVSVVQVFVVVEQVPSAVFDLGIAAFDARKRHVLV
jgi:hypothetical protein